MCWHLQNQMVILRGVLEVKFTKYCTCAAENPGQPEQYSRQWTGISYHLGVGTLYAKGIFREWCLKTYPTKSTNAQKMIPKSLPKSEWILGVAPLGAPLKDQTALGHQKWTKHDTAPRLWKRTPKAKSFRSLAWRSARSAYNPPARFACKGELGRAEIRSSILACFWPL